MQETSNLNGTAVTRYSPQGQTSKPPIIMVHGGNHAGWCWDKWATFFSENGYEVYVFDWLNHGASSKLPEAEFIKRSILDIAKREMKDVAGQLDKTPIVIGHSMGGLAAVAYATESPVEKLVLLAPVMTKAAGAEPMPLPVDMSAPVPVFPYPQAKQMFFTSSSDEDAQTYYAKLEPESPTAVAETIGWTVDLDLSKITMPVLVIGAALDQLIAEVPLKHYAELMHADYKQIPGVGHADLLLKDPEWREVATGVKDWLQ